MNEQSLKKVCTQLMQTTDLVYVSTVDENNCPQTRAMGNLWNLEQFGSLADFFKQHEHDFITYMSTNRLSLKMDQIQKNPNVCLYYCSFPETHGLSLIGTMRVVEDEELRKALWQDGWIQFYEGGLEGDDYTLLRVTPELARGWYQTDKFEFKI